ncbi:MAG: S8 family serine peptidase, partial [Chloroflexales bacterium]|nr:S8 family serine peptidase [Chloroflexales bacterium]
ITRGKGVTVAILDTGIDPNHPVFANTKILPGRDFVDNDTCPSFANTKILPGHDFVDNDTCPIEVGSKEQNITYGHGTHVAGLIALSAPEAKIMPIRVLDENGVGNLWVLIEGLKYAVNNIPPNNSLVINLSMSYTRESHILEDIVTIVADDKDDCQEGGEKEITEKDDLCVPQGGVVVVTAAGNSGSDQPEYPAAEHATGSLAVAASKENEKELASFSNYGQWVDIAAPGKAIWSSVPNNKYGSWSGTSMAAPLVAGTAALVRSQHSAWSSTQVVNHIIKTATQTNAEVPRRLDAAAAVGAAMPTNVVRIPMVLR